MHAGCRTLQQRYVMDPRCIWRSTSRPGSSSVPEIVGEIAETLTQTGLDPSSLVLEITESVMMQDMDLSIQRLAEPQASSAYSSRSTTSGRGTRAQLHPPLPVDILKVDKSFVDGVNERGEESALTAAIIELAGILRLRRWRRASSGPTSWRSCSRCAADLGQGFYFAKLLTRGGGRAAHHAPDARAPGDRASS